MRVHPLRATPPPRSFSFSSFDSAPSQLRAMGPDRFRPARVYRTSIARTCLRGREGPQGGAWISPLGVGIHSVAGTTRTNDARRSSLPSLPLGEGFQIRGARPLAISRDDDGERRRCAKRRGLSDVPPSAKVRAILLREESSALGARGCRSICRATNFFQAQRNFGNFLFRDQEKKSILLSKICLL